MTLQFDPTATEQQQEDMRKFRKYMKDKYTIEFPTARMFDDLVTLLTDRLAAFHWSRADVKVVMDYLVEGSWSFTAPMDFILENAERFVKIVQHDETNLEILHESGFFDVTIPLIPVHNHTDFKTELDELKSHTALMVRLQQFGQTPKPSFKQSISALIKGKKHFPRPQDN